jgi:alpha-amylase
MDLQAVKTHKERIMKHILKGLVILVALLFTSSLAAGVMMQGFYWDVPAGGNWYNTMKAQAAGLRSMAGGVGINRIWFPPPSKAQGGGYSMGYDPYDYYDLGQLNQHGTTETRFGSQAELKAAITEFRNRGVVSMADIVLNHRSGGASEANPRKGGSTWTDFRGVKSGKAAWRWDSFHPNNFCASDPGVFAGFPDICYRAGSAYNDMKTWLNWLKSTSNAGFTGGWRWDFVKGVHAWVFKDMKAATGGMYSIGELWDANTTTLNNWCNDANASAFDFALYYTLKNICNNGSGGGYLPDVLNHSKSFAARWAARAVTFVGNHDTDEIVRDKMMAYAFILTYQGYPTIFWKDYFNYGLAAGGGAGTRVWGNGIKQLVWCREKLAAGGPNIQLMRSGDGDCLIYGSYGYSTAAPGYIVVINDHPTAWRGYWVTTGNNYLKNKTLKAYAWSSSVSGQNYAPANKFCAADGRVEVWAAPRGYAVYSVNGL